MSKFMERYSFNDIFLFVVEVIPNVSIYLLVDLDNFMLAKHFLHFFIVIMHQAVILLLQHLYPLLQLLDRNFVAPYLFLKTKLREKYMIFSYCYRRK